MTLRLVQIGEDVWVNPAWVTAVRQTVYSDGREVRVVTRDGLPYVTDWTADAVLTALTAEPAQQWPDLA